MTRFLPPNSETKYVKYRTMRAALSRQLCDFSLSEVVRQIVFLHSPEKTAGEGVVPSAPLYLIS